MINNSGKEMNEVCIKECGDYETKNDFCAALDGICTGIYIWMCIKLVEQLTVKVAIYGWEKFKLVTH